jgi:hypothetical protein
MPDVAAAIVRYEHHFKTVFIEMSTTAPSVALFWTRRFNCLVIGASVYTSSNLDWTAKIRTENNKNEYPMILSAQPIEKVTKTEPYD